MKKGGIYIYYFDNNKSLSYIGSTNSFKKRRADHYRELRRCKHYNDTFQNAFNEYGEDSMVYEELEEMKFPVDYDRMLMKQHLEARELYWQLKYNSKFGKVFGGCGQSMDTLWKYTDIIKKPVYELDESGNIIQEFSSIAEASKMTGFTHGAISTTINLKYCNTERCKGRIFRSKDTIGKVKSPGIGKGGFRSLAINVYNSYGEFVNSYSAIHNGAIDLSLSRSAMRECCLRNIKQIHGYQVRYIDDIQDVIVLKPKENALMDKMSRRKPFC